MCVCNTIKYSVTSCDIFSSRGEGENVAFQEGSSSGKYFGCLRQRDGTSTICTSTIHQNMQALSIVKSFCSSPEGGGATDNTSNIYTSNISDSSCKWKPSSSTTTQVALFSCNIKPEFPAHMDDLVSERSVSDPLMSTIYYPYVCLTLSQNIQCHVTRHHIE